MQETQSGQSENYHNGWHIIYTVPAYKNKVM
jgi:hypothetical protein